MPSIHGGSPAKLQPQPSLAEQIAILQKQVAPSPGGSPSHHQQQLQMMQQQPQQQQQQQQSNLAEQIALLQKQLGLDAATGGRAVAGGGLATSSSGAGGVGSAALQLPSLPLPSPARVVPPIQAVNFAPLLPMQVIAPPFLTPVKGMAGSDSSALPQQPVDLRSTLPMASPSLGGSEVLSALQQQLQLQQQLFHVRSPARTCFVLSLTVSSAAAAFATAAAASNALSRPCTP
jgi:hypothetical protein